MSALFTTCELWKYDMVLWCYTYAVNCGYCTRTHTRSWGTRTRTCTRSYCTRNIPGFGSPSQTTTLSSRRWMWMWWVKCLTDTLPKRNLHVGLDSPTHWRILPTPWQTYIWGRCGVSYEVICCVSGVTGNKVQKPRPSFMYLHFRGAERTNNVTTTLLTILHNYGSNEVLFILNYRTRKSTKINKVSR